MSATDADLKRWFEQGKQHGHTHMIIMCDTFDYEDYPVYVDSEPKAREYVRDNNNNNMQRVMEVYNLRLTFEEQCIPRTRVFNY